MKNTIISNLLKEMGNKLTTNEVAVMVAQTYPNSATYDGNRIIIQNTPEGIESYELLKETFRTLGMRVTCHKRGRNPNRKQFYGEYTTRGQRNRARQDLKIKHSTHFAVYYWRKPDVK